MQENTLFIRSEITQDGKQVYQLVDEDGNDRGLFAVIPVQEYEAETGAYLIAAERARQVLEEDCTAEHDDQHDQGELAEAAVAYALASRPDSHVWVNMFWPWSNDWLKLSDPIRDLTKAGALIAAEIDRRLRIKIQKEIKGDI